MSLVRSCDGLYDCYSGHEMVSRDTGDAGVLEEPARVSSGLGARGHAARHAELEVSVQGRRGALYAALYHLFRGRSNSTRRSRLALVTGWYYKG